MISWTKQFPRSPARVPKPCVLLLVRALLVMKQNNNFKLSTVKDQYQISNSPIELVRALLVMSWFNHVGRIVNGLSLVAKETANRSQTVQTARTGDVETLIISSIKKVVVTATDIAGLTKGTVRELSNPRPKESVVYFHESVDVAEPSPPKEQPINDKDRVADQSASISSQVSSDAEKSEETGIDSSPANLETERESNSLSENVNVGVQIEAAVAPPQRRRKPRERKVPSTPISRLIG